MITDHLYGACLHKPVTVFELLYAATSKNARGTGLIQYNAARNQGINIEMANTERRAPGRPAKLTHEQVVREALSLLDQDGPDFSVRKLASELDSSAASIYNLFGNRDGLLQAIAHAALGDAWLPCRQGGAWDENLALWANTMRHQLLKKPNRLGLLGMSFFSQFALDNLRDLAVCITGSGLSFEESITAAQSLIWQVIGSVLLQHEQSSRERDVRSPGDLAATQNRDIAPHIARRTKKSYDALWQYTLSTTIAGMKHHNSH